MKKRSIVILSAVVLVFLSVFLFSGSTSTSTSDILVAVEEGQFIVDIMTSGELEAKNSVKITGPNQLRNYRIWNVTIQDMIDEGTFVNKGQYVARLDPSEVTSKIQDAQLEVQQKLSQFTQTKLDTTLTMREALDELVNLEYTVKERQLTLDQSQFEPPATIRKAEIELEKAKRSLSQTQENYDIKREQNIAKMQEVAAALSKAKNELNGLNELSKEFTILAPEDGMLIYRKSYNGKPVKSGSQISTWDPTVAILPDLSKMQSKTYVNEVDIRKVKVGQKVEIGFDAFPDKKLEGKVIKVANVGEQRPNSDAKVFVVLIEVFGLDPLLKPGMTTSNKIITSMIDETFFIPLECLHSEHDSITYVYKKSGGRTTKQEVKLGVANSEYVIVEEGLDQGDRISMSTVYGMENDEVTLLPSLNGKRSKKDESVSKSEPQH